MSDEQAPVEGKKGTTYADAGVDIHVEERSISALVSTLAYSREAGRYGALAGNIGTYTSLLEFGDRYLSICTDGVGSKMQIAERMGKLDTVGEDCIAMNVNDMICHACEPLAFVDYLACERTDPEVSRQIGVGLAKGAHLSDITIAGGETATLPDLINGVDLAGSLIGWVSKEDVVTGKDISPGDILIGISSSGIHSNGYTLVRRLVDDAGLDLERPFLEACALHDVTVSDQERDSLDLQEMSLGEVLLEPTRIYVRPVMATLAENTSDITALWHVTGSGLRKLLRYRAPVELRLDEPLPILPVFRLLQALGSVSDQEMHTTFNMGLGFVIAVKPGTQAGIIAALTSTRLAGFNDGWDVRVIGSVHPSDVPKVEVPSRGLSFQ